MPSCSVFPFFSIIFVSLHYYVHDLQPLKNVNMIAERKVDIWMVYFFYFGESSVKFILICVLFLFCSRLSLDAYRAYAVNVFFFVLVLCSFMMFIFLSVLIFQIGEADNLFVFVFTTYYSSFHKILLMSTLIETESILLFSLFFE